MEALAGMLNSISNLALVVAGFTFIIFIHELGHFAAARWAGIRVLAFAIGFGPAIFSFRKGMGFRRGSSESDYLALDAARRRDVSSTEYRLNWIPFGGYVKMLGQEDGNPEAVSNEADSFQNCHPAKRLVVISAGVVMNVILSAILVMVVFSVGLKVNPPRAGFVDPGSAASKAVAENADKLGITTPGILPGDQFVEIDGRTPNSYADLLPAVALAKKDSAISIKVRRAGFDTPIHFMVRPQKSEFSGLYELGVDAPKSARLFPANSQQELDVFSRVGLANVEPGSTLTTVTQGTEVTPVKTGEDLQRVVENSNGRPLTLAFKGPSGNTSTATITPIPESQIDLVQLSNGREAPVNHIAGLVGVMSVSRSIEGDRGYAAGLRTGDVFLRIGGVEYPSLAQGMSEIRSNAGRIIPVLVQRSAGGILTDVSLNCPVDKEGRIGFAPGETSDTSSILASPLRSVRAIREGATERRPPADSLKGIAGSSVTSINGTAVSTVSEAADLIKNIVQSTNGDSVTIQIGVRPTLPSGQTLNTAAEHTHAVQIAGEDLSAIRRLRYTTRIAGMFQPDEIVLKADSPADAISKGIDETRRWMLSVYVTFARLVERTVPIDQLRGPIGIAALGTTIADRGVIYLLFFMAMISVNLAVINFLPLPIVDGGQFLFILYEWIRGKAAPIAFQSAATMVGLIMIGAMFLLVTFNDITNLFRP